MTTFTESSFKHSKNYILKLFLLSIGMVGAMTTWFAMTAVLPELTRIWGLTGVGASFITIVVQAGFVIGALLSAFLNLPDRLAPNRLFFWSACIAGATTVSTVYLAETLTMVLIFRFVTGMVLAGVYGPGLKLASSWFRESRGMALGCVVGALTLGSAAPHLFRVSSLTSWEMVLILSGIAAIAAGLLVRFAVPAGPYHSYAGEFDPRAIPRVLKNKAVRLANFGYFGHSWELYAMWTWLGLFLTHSFTESGVENPSFLSSLLTFVVIGSGFFGAWFGGVIADRLGRERLALWSLGISGMITLLIGFLYGTSPWLIGFFAVIWGVSIIADSAQFSALIAENADQKYVGSALTFQLAVGYALTIVVIWLVSWVETLIGWQFAFVILLPGPILGFISILRLHRS